MKTCAKCGESKNFDEFSKNSKRRDGLQNYCKLCAKKSYEAWIKSNPGYRTAATYSWRVANPDVYKSKKALYREANKDRISAYSACWYLANKAKAKATSAAWKAANKEAYRVHQQNRRAKKRATGGKLSNGLSERLFKLQRGKCACCGKQLGNNYHLDHIMPLVLGGSNTDDNIQLLRAECNHRKSAKHPVDFMQQRGFLL
jgi:hypothetical protein